jgi:dynein heavy chain
MRDVSKVFQGLYQANKNYYEAPENIVKLWAHEALRVFSDRLNTDEDRALFKSLVSEQCETQLSHDYEEHCMTDGIGDAMFVDFLNDLGESIYAEVTDFEKLKSHLNEALIKYNNTPKFIKMDLVLFKDAIIHITKIHRILSMRRGNALLIGVGGSGRHSLTRLASSIESMTVFQLEIIKGFKLKNFRESLKVLYEWAGFRGKEKLKTTFIFADNDVVQESFLEDIQNMLNSGLVPNLFAADELNKLRDEFRRYFKRDPQNKTLPETPDNMDAWFFNNIKDNLHLSITFSPLSKNFKEYCRNYPALINNTTIDWFMKWPEDALQEVANKFLNDMDIEKELVPGLANLCAAAQASTYQASDKMQLQLKRIFYVTPTNFIELLKGYREILEENRKVILAKSNKLRNGLNKLEGARQQVETMSAETDIKRADVQKNSREVDELIIRITADQKVADEKQTYIEQQTEIINREKAEAEALAADAENDLKKYEPELIKAQEAIDSLDNKSIAEIKAYTTPPVAVMTVMSAVMVVFQREATWPSAKKMMSEPGFLKTIVNYPKD